MDVKFGGESAQVRGPHSIHKLPCPNSPTFSPILNMPKATRKAVVPRHDPLAQQIIAGEADSGLLSAPGKRQKQSKKRSQEEEVSASLMNRT